jgi:REP-associated tyrosine transposase
MINEHATNHKTMQSICCRFIAGSHIFVSQNTCSIITDSLRYCHHNKLRINAYVIMPTHLHFIVFDAGFDSNRLAGTLADFRKFTGRQLADSVVEKFPSCMAEALRANAASDRERRLWQPSRHPEPIVNEVFWKQKLDYVHDNPCRKGLVRRADYWRYSSAAWYLSDCTMSDDVPITAIEW